MAIALRRLKAAVWPMLLVVAVVCSVVVVRDAAGTPPTYTTGYDGIDPGRCAFPASQVAIVAGGQASLFDDSGEHIGIVRLRRSQKCSTMWAQVLLTPKAARQLKGRVIQIVVHRLADNRTAPYPLLLRGGSIGFGNQLGATACIRGEAQLVADPHHRDGPVAITRCL